MTRRPPRTVHRVTGGGPTRFSAGPSDRPALGRIHQAIGVPVAQGRGVLPVWLVPSSHIPSPGEPRCSGRTLGRGLPTRLQRCCGSAVNAPAPALSTPSNSHSTALKGLRRCAAPLRLERRYVSRDGGAVGAVVRCEAQPLLF